jgi:hypothetical protein
MELYMFINSVGFSPFTTGCYIAPKQKEIFLIKIFMGSIYSKDQLVNQLTQLKDKRDLVQKSRVAILEKYSRKVTQEKKEVEAGIELYQLELKIEEVERRLEKLF